MLTILIITNSFFGLHKFRIEMVKSLQLQGFHIVISGPDYEYSFPFQEIGCKIVYSSFDRHNKNPFKDLLLCYHYVHLIKKYRPVVILTYTMKPNIYGGIACRLTGVKQIANITGLGDAIERGGVLSILLKFLLKIGLKKTTWVVFQNASNLEFCKRTHIVENATKLLPGSGVNLEYHTVYPYPQDSCTRFIFIGRIKRDKGIIELLASAKKLKNVYGGLVKVQILGSMEDDFTAEIKSLANQGIVSYLGSVFDVRPYLYQSNCLVLPSYHEGLSNVCLEASAAGRPVITTNVPGCKETVIDGKTGYLVKPKDIADLTEKMDQFVRLSLDEKKKMGLAARRKVEKEFDRQIVIDWYVETILELTK